MNDTLSLIVHSKVSQAELLDILLKSHDLSPRIRLSDESRNLLEILAG
jgi:hypothetical protein